MAELNRAQRRRIARQMGFHRAKTKGGSRAAFRPSFGGSKVDTQVVAERPGEELSVTPSGLAVVRRKLAAAVGARRG